MKKLILTLSLGFSLFIVRAQNQLLFQENFNHAAAYESTTGINGMALNLTATAKKRKPLIMQSLNAPSSGSFTTVLWVKAAPVDDQDYILLSNQKEKTDSSEATWQLGKQATGAWYWSAVQGKSKYEYRPTLSRQPVNDGNWHQLAFTFNKEHKEVRLYYDGRNVAVYFTPELSSLLTKQSQLIIGGPLSGDLSEWETFNGTLDELQVYDSLWSAAQIMNAYRSISGRALKIEKVSTPVHLKVMNYNIWHGGHETGKYIGPGRIAEVIKESDADIISMQETYGSGARIADELGYYFYLRSTNLSIMSRYPIEETITGIHPFYNGGAHIDLGSGKKNIIGYQLA